MKFLKKFNTEEEYEEYLMGKDFVRPCIARIVDDKAVKYRKRYKNGVYIQHVNGKLFTTEQWTENGFANDLANGVAVINGNVSFVIAKTEISSSMDWSSDTQNEVSGILLTRASTIAKKDFAGQKNTLLMLATDTNEAGYSCANYVFPNGQKGYLPALGEWEIAYQNSSAIYEAMSLIGGTQFNNYYWSSTQYSANFSWNL
jgi:hypothetical protein